MVIKKMYKKIVFFIIFNVFVFDASYSSENDFQSWIKSFKIRAVEAGISEKLLNDIMLDVRFLPKVIEYDRYQPEFYEDTFTYIKKRTSKKKVKDGLKLYKKEKKKY